jgi:nucleotide-binding universal stress UspA family protein
MALPRKILVPTDFSENSDRALDYALRLAEEIDAEVYVLHVYDVPLLSVPDAPWVVTSDMIHSIERAAKTALERLTSLHKREPVKMRALLKSGDPRAGIEAAVAEIGANLIIIGTHGRRGGRRPLLGSVADYIISTADIPVVTVPGHKEHAAIAA